VLNLPLQHPYFRQEILLTTKHNKYAAVAPAFQEHLKMTVVEHTADTDLFGTFSGEIERTLSAGQSAVAKAKMGLGAMGLINSPLQISNSSTSLQSSIKLLYTIAV
jgi:hypothetical protein